MRSIPNTYQEALLHTYNNMRQNGVLTENLRNSTRNNLRNECLRLSREKPLSVADSEILQVFFNRPEPEADYTPYMFDDGKFKALDNLLKGEVENSHIRNLDLLAWMIDFPERPFPVWEQSNKAAQKRGNNPPTVKKAAGFNWSKLLSNKRWVSTLTAILVVIAAFAYYNTELKKRCMYWTGDQYKPVSCNETVNAFVIPLDKKKVERLKRITNVDTLTYNALRYVWYVKVNTDSVEFYTDSGDYPLDTRKRLRPVTEYMLEKYVFSKRQKEVN